MDWGFSRGFKGENCNRRENVRAIGCYTEQKGARDGYCDLLDSNLEKLHPVHSHAEGCESSFQIIALNKKFS